MEPTEDMIEAGCEVLYGHTRAEAIEWAKEEKFDGWRDMARDVWLAMWEASVLASNSQVLIDGLKEQERRSQDMRSALMPYKGSGIANQP